MRPTTDERHAPIISPIQGDIPKFRASRLEVYAPTQAKAMCPKEGTPVKPTMRLRLRVRII